MYSKIKAIHLEGSTGCNATCPTCPRHAKLDKELVFLNKRVPFNQNLTVDDIDWLIPHQANIRIIQAVAKRLGMPMEKVIVTLAEHGNTSAASIPLALDKAITDGRISKGDRILLQGFGAGFTWGTTLLTL